MQPSPYRYRTHPTILAHLPSGGQQVVGAEEEEEDEDEEQHQTELDQPEVSIADEDSD